MILNTDAERLQFLSMDHFAVSCTIDGAAAVGVFRDAWHEALGVDTTNPFLKCLASAVAGKSQGDPVVIGSTTYAIAGIEPDGKGFATIQLEEAVS